MVYGAIYAAQQSLPELNVRLTYYQIDNDQIIRFIRRFTQQELDEFLEHDKEVLNGCRGFTSYASPSSPLDS